MQEEIKIKGESKRTIVKYFTTFSGQTGPEYFVVTDLNDKPLKITDSFYDANLLLNDQNYNVPTNQLIAGAKIYSGTVVEYEYKSYFTEIDKSNSIQNYINKIKNQAGITANSSASDEPFSYAFFEEYPFTDYYMNVKINQSINTLDTLNIYNVALNETPKFSNNTGVLIGKLEAIQLIEDENGEKIRIPLKNTVVGIFNQSETFPYISSSDEEGNRIRLNLYETIPQIENIDNLKGYSSFQSYLTDVSYAKKDSKNTSIPDQYRYTTITNENGEFILQNIPIGQQTLMVEADLLKLGLDPEEVALNFFPYPTQDDPNVSELPHLFFGQYPINIVPSWGDFQTGYTEMKLSISLDLRKWSTYFIYPISSRASQQSEKPFVMEELFLQGITNTQKVLIRDMTKDFNIKIRPKVELVKIPNVKNKNLDLNIAWDSEYKVKDNKVEFDVTAFNAFKLPSNLYDPNGINSKGEKGVWLNAYTFKVFYGNDSDSFNATGMVNNWVANDNGQGAHETFANHFDLSFVNGWERSLTPGSIHASPSIGIWPYQKPWSINYPEPYHITKKPKIINPYKQWDANGQPLTNISGYTIVPQLEPKCLDGDLVGGSDAWATNANGYGLQDYFPGVYGNMFSREVTKNEIWRYEAMDWWSDDWSNGYNPVCTTAGQEKYLKIPGCPPTGKPDINMNESERFMRLESGYAYWLKPRGWPRVNVKNGWGDLLLSNDTNLYSDHQDNSVYPGYYSLWNGVYKYFDDVTLIVGQRSPWYSRYGRITSYRIEKPYYTNPEKGLFKQKFVTLNFGAVLCDGGSPCGGSNRYRYLPHFDVGTGQENQLFEAVNIKMTIKNRGSVKVFIDGTEVFPGDVYETRFGNKTTITLPANSNFNPKDNCYDRADYELVYFGTKNDQGSQPNASYGGDGEGCGIFIPYAWPGDGRSIDILHYEFDGKDGLPAFDENDERKNYYASSIPCFYFRYPISITTIQNYFEVRSYRIAGLVYMANHNGCPIGGWPFLDTKVKWTRTKPSVYLTSGGFYTSCKLLYDSAGTSVPDVNFRNIE